jgi:protein-tyrosine phosphatase
MTVRVDLHCHLLPGLDDGPRTDEDTLTLARALVADGVGTVAATPHRTVRFATPLHELLARVDAVRRLLADADVPLEVLTGSEVAVDALLDMPETELQALRLGGSGPLLVELPQRDVGGDPSWIVHSLLDRGVPVLLAHPERIPLLQADPSILAGLVAKGAHAQVTSGSFIGRYGHTAQLTAVEMLDAGLVDVLASDAHHAELRPPELSAARDWLATHRPAIAFDDLAVHTPSLLISPRTAPASS